MKCDRCGAAMAPAEAIEHLGQALCEDCHMEILSAPRTCDPWAVHAAKSHERHADQPGDLTPLQDAILEALKAHGPMEPAALRQKLGGPWSLQDLEREFSALRHMEKVRGEKQGLRVLWRLW